ncbi:uncharacterized protein LOC110260276 [Sus scrofa]|uniref:uncharacterized protein LOC110260276 n=1 Tax=Sus scrofa TaxID=9823 RepID=UPI000A2B1BF0|nr:uncharacterized protein LOC110260276 [Sus scrofa]
MGSVWPSLQGRGWGGEEARGHQLSVTEPPPHEAVNNAYLGVLGGKRRVLIRVEKVGTRVRGAILSRLDEESESGEPSGTDGSGRLSGSALRPAGGAGTSAAGRSCGRWPWSPARPLQPPETGAGKPAPSPAAPITNSCFCLALRGSVCPNPRPLPGLHLLCPSLPFPASSPAPQRPGVWTLQCSHARWLRAPGCGTWGRER